MHNYDNNELSCSLVYVVVKETYFYLQNWQFEDSMCHYCVRLNMNVSISKFSVL